MFFKTKTFLIILFVCTLNLSAQEHTSIEDIRFELQELFKKITKETPQQIIPYTIKGKTGLLHSESLKVLVKPTPDLKFYSLFNPIMRGIYKMKYHFELIETPTGIEIQDIIMRNYSEISGRSLPKEPEVEIIDSKNGYKGFKVDENGKLKAYSDLYHIQSGASYNVNPFLFEGKYYSVVSIETAPNTYLDAIIDTNGIALPHFNFTDKCIIKIKVEEDDIWYSTGLCRGLTGSLKSFKGKVKYDNEIPGYLLLSSNIFKYNHNYSKDRKKHGIFDLEQLTWTIEPTTAFNIEDLYYTSKEHLNTALAENRSKATIYFLVSKKNKSYFMDLNLKKYLPK